MILKQKKNCKLIFCNEKYYIKTNKNIYFFADDYTEATEYYENIVEIEKKGRQVFKKGKFHIELYPEDMKIILKSLECFKFFVDKNIFFECDAEIIKKKCFDIDFLSEYIYSYYIQYKPKELEEEKERSKNGKILEWKVKK